MQSHFNQTADYNDIDTYSIAESFALDWKHRILEVLRTSDNRYQKMPINQFADNKKKNAFTNVYNAIMFQTNFGQIINTQRQYYINPLLHSLNKTKASVGIVFVFPNTQPYGSKPTDEFVPSERLVDIVMESLLKPDDNLWELVQKLRGTPSGIKAERENLSKIITREVEALMISVARRSYQSGESIRISENNQFTNEIGMEIKDRLSLDIYCVKGVSKQLYQEFFGFISQCQRKREWGNIVISGTEIMLDINYNAFKTI